MLEKGREVYTEVCFACHGDDGRGAPSAGSATAPRSARRWPPRRACSAPSTTSIKALLHGLTGPVNGTTYTDVMIPMGADRRVGRRDRLVHPQRVRQPRGDDHRGGRRARSRRHRDAQDAVDVAELVASLPQIAVDRLEGHREPQPATACDALTIQPWSSGQPQQAGMWLQVELPQPITSRWQFESPAALVEAEPAAPGAPTRIGGGRGGPAPPPAFPRTSRCRCRWTARPGAPVAKGQGTGASDGSLRAVRAKFVRITPDRQRRRRAVDAAAASGAGSAGECGDGCVEAIITHGDFVATGQ